MRRRERTWNQFWPPTKHSGGQPAVVLKEVGLVAEQAAVEEIEEGSK